MRFQSFYIVSMHDNETFFIFLIMVPFCMIQIKLILYEITTLLRFPVRRKSFVLFLCYQVGNSVEIVSQK